MSSFFAVCPKFSLKFRQQKDRLDYFQSGALCLKSFHCVLQYMFWPVIDPLGYLRLDGTNFRLGLEATLNLQIAELRDESGDECGSKKPCCSGISAM